DLHPRPTYLLRCYIFFFLLPPSSLLFCFFFTDPTTTETYTLSLHDALPILIQPWLSPIHPTPLPSMVPFLLDWARACKKGTIERSEEHTSELQSRRDLVCRLLLEKKNKVIKIVLLRRRHVRVTEMAEETIAA